MDSDAGLFYIFLRFSTRPAGRSTACGKGKSVPVHFIQGTVGVFRANLPCSFMLCAALSSEGTPQKDYAERERGSALKGCGGCAAKGGSDFERADVLVQPCFKGGDSGLTVGAQLFVQNHEALPLGRRFQQAGEIPVFFFSRIAQ